MSVLVYGEPISTWSIEELIEELDIMASFRHQNSDIAVLAEALSRLLKAAKSEDLIK